MSTERLTRYKHDYLYPTNVLHKYLETINIDPKDIKKVFIGLPFQNNCTTKFSAHLNEKEELFRKIFNVKYFKDVKNAKREMKYGGFYKNYSIIFKSGLSAKFWKSRILKNLKIFKMVNGANEVSKIMQNIFVNAEITARCFNHSYAHIMSSYYSSPFKEATLITMDGSGDGSFSQAYSYKNSKLAHISTSQYVDKINEKVGTAGSVGEIYSHFTTLLGFQALADEGKVEALAAYGNHKNEIYNGLMNLVKLDKKKHCLVLDAKKSIDFLNTPHPYIFA